MRRRPQAEGEEKYNLNVEGGVVVFPDGRKFRMYETGLVPVADDDVDTPRSRWPAP